jgi:hypothetical protein
MSARLIIVSNRVVAPEEADSSLADELAATVKAALKSQLASREPSISTKSPMSRSTCRTTTFRNIATGSPIACSGLFSTTALTYRNIRVLTRAVTSA